MMYSTIKILTWGLFSALILAIAGCLNQPSPTSTLAQSSSHASAKDRSAQPPIKQGLIKIVAPWTAYFSTQDTAVDWADSVRGVGRGQTGLPGSDTTSYVQALSDASLRTKNILLPVGGLDAGRNTAHVDTFMTQMSRDRGLSWKAIVYKQAIALTKVPGGSNRIAWPRITWQVGNEINSKRMSETLQNWAKEKGQIPVPNADWVIPAYVEYYLAPTVEAIRKASLKSFGSDNRIPIVLGSIANAYNPKSRRWLNALLDYRVKGTYAPSLANQSVSELVNIISIHYLVSSADENWQQSLDGIWNRWVGRGRVTGLWSTEELGKQRAMRGQGASTALKVTARYLHWWNLRGIPPGNGRVSFWGWRLSPTPGTSAQDGMQALYKVLGPSPVQEIPDGLSFMARQPSHQPLDSYVFQSSRQPNKRVGFVFARWSDRPHKNEATEHDNAMDDQTSLKVVQKNLLPTKIWMKAQGWHNPVDATVQVFSTEGSRVVPVSTRLQGASYELSFAEQVDLAPQSVALITLDHRP